MRHLFVMGILCAGLSMAAGAPESTSSEKHLFFRVNTTNSSRHILKANSGLLSGRTYSDEDPAEPHGSGFFANAGIFIPGESYMDPFYDGFDRDNSKFKTGITLDAGNYFRLLNTGEMGLGIRATWVQVGYGKHQNPNYSEGNAFASVLRVGPQASWMLGEEVGLDAFYQLGAQYNIDWYHQENLSFAGISHELGIAVRYTILSAGLGYKFGALKNVDTSDPKTRDINKAHKYDVKCLRLFVGIQL